MDETGKGGVLSLAKEWLPVLTVVFGAAWGLYTYTQQSRTDSATRLFEAQKPFLQMQLDLYRETTQIAGKLVTLDPATAEWESAERRFSQLMWSELSMVASDKVVIGLNVFRNDLDKFKEKKDDKDREEELRKSAHQLSKLIAAHFRSNWTSSEQPQPPPHI